MSLNKHFKFLSTLYMCLKSRKDARNAKKSRVFPWRTSRLCEINRTSFWNSYLDKKNSFFILPVLTLMLMSLLVTTSYASDAKEGKILHNANCLSCHKSIMNGEPDSIYVRENRRVNSYPALQNQVNRCEKNIGITWTQKQTDNVISYLNQQFYKFKN